MCWNSQPARDWDATSRSFRQDRAFSKFDERFMFSETREANGTRFPINRVTLHTVPNGNARKATISAAEFADDVGVSGLRPTGQ
jgi:hypothetical protein